MLQQLMKAFSDIPFNRMLGLRLEQLNGREALIQFAMQEDLIGNFLQGILHGGVISSVLDMAGGMVTMAAFIANNQELSTLEMQQLVSQTSTVDLNINYLRPGLGDLFIAESSLIKFGRSLVFTRMQLKNDSDQLIATGSGTYLLK